ncbi:hypothetical protein [Loktanella sp. 3ANDIMAR09]|uniref:hypothetical protein n=1 Tax=Loktanella sp. 3ANDIMAR09 TaxID=1225657 RepID=UPI0012EDBEAC|nr:hypothetical protein [Loktanella sp. 3ANDIMAR09]
MNFLKPLALTALFFPLAACGGAGHVGGDANRGSAIANEGANNEIVTRARADRFSFDEATGASVSTYGFAEVLYRTETPGKRIQVPDRFGDAESRARAVSGCEVAVADRSQNSFQGAHVIVGLAQCPAIQANGGLVSRFVR